MEFVQQDTFVPNWLDQTICKEGLSNQLRKTLNFPNITRHFFGTHIDVPEVFKMFRNVFYDLSNSFLGYYYLGFDCV